MNQWSNFTKGFIKESPTFALILGMCPTLGVSSAAINGLGMGLATTFVLAMSNLFISALKDFIPDKVRIPAFIVVIASFVTMVDLVMAAYVPALHKTLGIFIPQFQQRYGKRCPPMAFPLCPTPHFRQTPVVERS